MEQDSPQWPRTDYTIRQEWPHPEIVFTIIFPAGAMFSEVDEFLHMFEWAVGEARIWGAWIS